MIYLDHAATTPVPRGVADAMYEVLTEQFGNPSSQYPMGLEMKRRVEVWRKTVADALGCGAKQLFFTSCGTEADNWAVTAACWQNRHLGRHIVTTAVEHSAVLEACRWMERQGYEVTYLVPAQDGSLSAEQVLAAVRQDTALVSCMLVNNELGTLLPVAEAAQSIRDAGSPALLHCDAVQAFLKVPFTPAELGVDLLTVSGHKIHAPKGIGALYVRRGLKLPPLIRGGGQEGGLRSGTEATAQIAAFAAAVRAGTASREGDIRHMAGLKAETLARLQEAVPGLKPIGSGTAPHILAVTLPGYKSEVIVRFLSDRGICLSSGSACHKGKPSHVYAALKLPKCDLDGALRISFSYDTTQQDVEALADGLRAAKEQLFPTLS